MNYVFEFSQVFAAWDELLAGALRTLWLSAISMVLGLAVAVLGALAKANGPTWLRRIIDGYIEVIRNTPFLIQIFMVFFGLPAIGLRLEADEAALLAMVINVGAYGIEIIRAGVESIPKGQIEAGRALGLRPLQIFRLVVLKPALQAVYPSLTSQFILLMLNSSVCSAIAANELTAAANDIQARNFRSFEVYFVVTAIYFAMSVMFWGIFTWIERTFLARPASR